MTIKEHLSQSAQYNYWANQSMIEWFLAKDPALMDKLVNSSFPSINKTLSHIWMAEYLWMCRIEGIQWKNLSGRHEGQGTKVISEDLLDASKSFIDKIASISEKEMSTIIEYKLLSGEPSQTSMMNIVHHVMNHSNYHRGQLVTMGRALGFTDPPKSDFIHFIKL